MGVLGGAPPAQLGVRASILRGDQEVDLTTVLNAGESDRLKLTPNADGAGTGADAGQAVRFIDLGSGRGKVRARALTGLSLPLCRLCVYAGAMRSLARRSC